MTGSSLRKPGCASPQLQGRCWAGERRCRAPCCLCVPHQVVGGQWTAACACQIITMHLEGRSCAAARACAPPRGPGGLGQAGPPAWCAGVRLHLGSCSWGSLSHAGRASAAQLCTVLGVHCTRMPLLFRRAHSWTGAWHSRRRCAPGWPEHRDQGGWIMGQSYSLPDAPIMLR